MKDKNKTRLKIFPLTLNKSNVSKSKMRRTIVFGGQAGTGPNILTKVLGEVLVKKGYFVFYSRDYESLIRGGHNFNTLTFSEEEVYSNDSKTDLLVCLDDLTKKKHSKDLNKGGIILEGEHQNMWFAGAIFKILGLDFADLEKELKILEKRFDENIKEAKEGYSKFEKKINLEKPNFTKRNFSNGNQGITEGAIKSGLEVYYAYPMTPATPVMDELAKVQEKNNFLVLELENEIAVANAGVGSCIVGAKGMVGTSGGGFDLMTETLSLTGIANVPLVFYLCSRPGPATGVATYTSQGDLKLAINAGHGEFNRVVLVPGDPVEAEELTNQAFYFSHKFGIPSIIVGDKHLAESLYTTNEKPFLVKVPSKTKLKRFNSYETDLNGSATEDPEIIKKNVLLRNKVGEEVKKETKNFIRYKIYGKKASKNVVVCFGSVIGAVLDATKELDVKVIQILYIEPFAVGVEKELKGNLILVENDSRGSLADLIGEKTCIKIEEKNKILRFDGRPFFADELKEEIRRKLKK